MYESRWWEAGRARKSRSNAWSRQGSRTNCCIQQEVRQKGRQDGEVRQEAGRMKVRQKGRQGPDRRSDWRKSESKEDRGQTGGQKEDRK